MNPLVTSVKRSRIDEKVGMMYAYKNNVKHWEKRDLDVETIVDRIKTDIRSAGRFADSITKSPKNELKDQVSKITDRLREEEYSTKADEIENAFDTYFD